METSDIITLILGIASTITACGTILLSFRYNKLVQGQVEMQIRERITNARIRYEDLIINHKDELNDELIKMCMNLRKKNSSMLMMRHVKNILIRRWIKNDLKNLISLRYKVL